MLPFFLIEGNRRQTIVAEYMSKLFVSRVPKMRAIPQLLLASFSNLISRFTHTCLIWTPLYYGQFSFSLGEALTLPLKSICLIKIPIDTANGNFFINACPIKRFS